MLERIIAILLPEIIHLLELIGIIVITAGSVKSFFYYFLSFWKKEKYPVRIELGRALALGLEYKMGAEILKTVLIRDMSEIYILGAIICLRAVLSLLIHFEMKGDSMREEKSGLK